jgi:hypothetical protein
MLNPDLWMEKALVNPKISKSEREGLALLKNYVTFPNLRLDQNYSLQQNGWQQQKPQMSQQGFPFETHQEVTP